MINHTQADDRDADTLQNSAADNILSRTDLLTKLCPNDHAYYFTANWYRRQPNNKVLLPLQWITAHVDDLQTPTKSDCIWNVTYIWNKQ